VDAALSGGRGARALAANLAHSADFLAVLPYANFSELAGAVGVINVALYDPRPLPEPLTPAAVAGAVVLAVLACAGCCVAARCLRSRAAAKQAEVLTSVEASGVLTLAVAPSPYSPRAARAFGDLCAAGDAAAVRCALAGAPALVASRCAATGRTPLHEAAAAGHAAVVELLLAEGAAVDAVDFNGLAALALTVRGGGAAAGGVAAALLAAGADTEARDAAGRAPLHLAVAARSAALVGALLAAGAAPGALDGESRTPAQLAQALGAGDIVAALRDAPARPPSPRPAAPSPSASTRHAPRAEAAGRASPQRSEVALFVAGLSAAGVSAEKVAAALARNPALASAANEEGVTALHAATLAGNMPLVAALVAAGAAVDSHDAAGLSPLAVACRNGAAEVASLLLAQHANKAAALAQADNNGLSLLHHAVLSGQPAAVRALLAAGAPRAQRDRGGRTALDVAEMLRTETASTEGASEIGEIVGLLRG
jgi:ankyrin repeat protein